MPFILVFALRAVKPATRPIAAGNLPAVLGRVATLAEANP